MQCPPDFVGASALVGLSAALGRKIGIRPQRNTGWIEVPNLWGCVIARPGAMKSPAMSQAFAPLHRLEANARKANMAAAAEYAIELEAHKLKKEEAARKVRAVLKDGGSILTSTMTKPSSIAFCCHFARRSSHLSIGVRNVRTQDCAEGFVVCHVDEGMMGGRH
jgi:hypothetical protein